MAAFTDMTFADRCNLKSLHALLPILFEKIQHLSLGFLIHDAENAVIILILLANSIGMKEHNKIQRKEIDQPLSTCISLHRKSIQSLASQEGALQFAKNFT